MFKIVFALIFFAAWAQATPKNFEIWFISPDSVKSARLLNSEVLYGPFTAQNNLQCQPMGDYCFDPQVGMYKPGKGIESAAADYREADKMEDYDFKRKATGKERVDPKCDSDNMFDIFCGKGKKPKEKSAKFTIWFDISSSMKQVDFAGYEKMCQREAFLRLLARDCGFNEEMKIYGFNEAKKELGTMDSVCLNHGLNSKERLIRDIKNSDAKKLIVITDIFEADEELINFAERTAGGSLRGLKEPLYASDLKTLAGDLRKKCL